MPRNSKGKKKELTSGSSMVNEDQSQKIQKKAYELYKERGYSNGSDWADWFEAESLVESEQN